MKQTNDKDFKNIFYLFKYDSIVESICKLNNKLYLQLWFNECFTEKYYKTILYYIQISFENLQLYLQQKLSEGKILELTNELIFMKNVSYDTYSKCLYYISDFNELQFLNNDVNYYDIYCIDYYSDDEINNINGMLCQ